MERFNHLVGEQLKIMDHLLYIQSEIERYQEREKECQKEQGSIRQQIDEMKAELKEVQQQFEEQTKEVILSFNEAIEKKVHA